MKNLLLAAVLLTIAGPAHADDYCSNHFCLTPPALPPNLYVAPSGTSTLGGTHHGGCAELVATAADEREGGGTDGDASHSDCHRCGVTIKASELTS